MTPREVIEGYLGECFGPETRMDQIGLYAAEIQQALAAAGYAVVKTDPIQDQVIRALAAVGWAVVPVEPTEAMVKAGNMTGYKASVKTVTTDVWQAMIEAAQKDPA